MPCIIIVGSIRLVMVGLRGAALVGGDGVGDLFCSVTTGVSACVVIVCAGCRKGGDLTFGCECGA